MEANECYFQAKMQNIENEFHLKEMQLNQLLEEARMEMEENKSSGLNASTVHYSQRNITQRILTAKEEVQMSKDAAINESKLFLSKRVAELEKLSNEHEKH